jgi:hypothetical protein
MTGQVEPFKLHAVLEQQDIPVQYGLVHVQLKFVISVL